MFSGDFSKSRRTTHSLTDKRLAVIPLSDKLEEGRRRLRASAETSPELRPFCLVIAQTIVETFNARWAEVRLNHVPQGQPFALRWATPTQPRPQRSAHTMTAPIGANGQVLGKIQVARQGRMTRAQRHAFASLAEEATRGIYRAFGTTATLPMSKPERLQLAAELHHGVGHYVANAIMRLQLCQQHMLNDPARAEDLLRTSLTCAQVAMDTVRTAIRSLTDSAPNPAPFTTVLHTTVERLKIMTAAQFHLDIDLVHPLPPAIVPGIAAVACEALTNAVKHAQAQNIFLKLAHRDESVTLRVIDDGKGFDDEVRPRHHWSGFGLSLMQDQVRSLGGTFQLQSVLAQGTRVMVQIHTSQDAASSLQLTPVN